jgi:hypothetical protein
MYNQSLKKLVLPNILHLQDRQTDIGSNAQAEVTTKVASNKITNTE